MSTNPRYDHGEGNLQDFVQKYPICLIYKITDLFWLDKTTNTQKPPTPTPNPRKKIWDMVHNVLNISLIEKNHLN